MSDTKYCWQGSNVLKNRQGIKTKENLESAEKHFTAMRMLELQLHPIDGRFDFNHLCRIHKHIFQDIYDWAGEPRTVDIGKGNLFCRVQNIKGYADSIFDRFRPDCADAKDDRQKFVHVLAGHYGDMNALHPFREGNGRAQREFTRELCLECGYEFDLTGTTHQEMLAASILSFNKGDSSGLEQIFTKAIHPIGDMENLAKRLQETITVLSADDLGLDSPP